MTREASESLLIGGIYAINREVATICALSMLSGSIEVRTAGQDLEDAWKRLALGVCGGSA